tara:strand:+ start:1150 stop:1308 length:159 start_codon:yes stop_codon:yes gene_type:complete
MTFKRWVVVYLHDKSPVDGSIFVHKNKAWDFLKDMKNPHKYTVIKMELNQYA